MKQIRDHRLYFFLFLPLLILVGCFSARKLTGDPVVLRTTPSNGVRDMEIEFRKGKAYNHPSFAIWLEDNDGKYIETLYVTRYVAKGEFRYGEAAEGKWKNEPGEVRRPATLPYWAHKRDIKAPDGLYIPSPETAVPDALTAATPLTDFTLITSAGYSDAKAFRVMMEINQAWDSNEFWTNSKYADDPDYFSSLQPALVYAVIIEPQDTTREYSLNPLGHSHPSGENGRLYTDLTTLTTAKEIAKKITVRLK